MGMVVEEEKSRKKWEGGGVVFKNEYKVQIGGEERRNGWNERNALP